MNLYIQHVLSKMFSFCVIVLLIITFRSVQVFGSTIIPYDNYGEMAIHSSTVVYVKALVTYEFQENEVLFEQTDFELIEIIKGQVPQRITVRGMTSRIGNLYARIDGDSKYVEGRNYLLMLEPRTNGLWKTKLMSYGVMEEVTQDQIKLLVPTEESRKMSLLAGPEFEPIQNYGSFELIQMLKEVTSNATAWAGKEIAVNYEFESQPKVSLRAQPSHCTYLADSKWQNLDSDELEIYSHEDGDPDKAGVASIVQSAISDMLSNYDDILLSYEGTHDYVPNASETNAYSGGFTTYSNGVNRGRNILIQYDDPSDEIDDLSNCSGILAVGGMYSGGSSTEFNGNTWSSNSYGFVVVNNGVGACLSNNNYKILMEHEMTHALGLGHISSSNRANMNPSCCNTITSNDIECSDFAYVAESLPLDLLSFVVSENKEVGVDLEWETVNEINHSHFEVQHSRDGYEFDVLETIENEDIHIDHKFYSYLHLQPQAGINYYRLKQYDFDGSYIYTPVRSIEWKKDTSKLLLSPNPAVSEVLVQNLGRQPADYLLTDLAGRLIQKGALTFNRLNVQNLTSGTYILTILQGEQSFVERLIVM